MRSSSSSSDEDDEERGLPSITITSGSEPSGKDEEKGGSPGGDEPSGKDGGSPVIYITSSTGNSRYVYLSILYCQSTVDPH